MKHFNILVISIILYSFTATAESSWDELAYQGKKYREEGNLAKAVQFLSAAADKKRTNNHELYLYAGILAARLDNSDEAFKLLNKSIRSGMWDIHRLERNSRLQNIRQDKRWNDLIESIKTEENRYLSRAKITHPELRSQLKTMWEKDQNFVGRKEQLNVIKSNSIELKKIIADIGWPTKSKVGRDGEWLAWAITQHSHDIEFQKMCLGYLKNLTLDDKIDPVYFAELTDRIARNTGSSQIYGMAIIRENGKKMFYQIFDPENVDIRRSEIGLPPIKVWANENFVEIDPLANKKSQQDSPVGVPLL
ncbi:DUF6624 domain-containing protein [Agaribacter marinus]|uniref:Tetratricopeptide repeat protein n=1 Tax=Agaribacter marinus TaxID=1431249 RepID=A0AA37T1K4_9ALTE|nr:DUF6624 domain-containing protein [Agaribacter marinus]GLR70763.1 hypothetical protein GCM10007852_16710 [Agaribacter marinus]